eukprot:6041876-Pyramimonas_sp.AAC.2
MGIYPCFLRLTIGPSWEYSHVPSARRPAGAAAAPLPAGIPGQPLGGTARGHLRSRRDGPGPGSPGPPAGVGARRGSQLPGRAQRVGNVPRGPWASGERLL